MQDSAKPVGESPIDPPESNKRKRKPPERFEITNNKKLKAHKKENKKSNATIPSFFQPKNLELKENRSPGTVESTETKDDNKSISFPKRSGTFPFFIFPYICCRTSRDISH